MSTQVAFVPAPADAAILSTLASRAGKPHSAILRQIISQALRAPRRAAEDGEMALYIYSIDKLIQQYSSPPIIFEDKDNDNDKNE